MTQEQKVRTRDELISFAAAYINRHTLPDCWNDVDDMVDEIMKAGAAEARREDAEGHEPVAFQILHHATWREAIPANEAYWNSRAYKVRPLYSRPANVAAFEARVKELEAERDRLTRQLQALQPGKVRPVIHSPTRFMDDARSDKKEGSPK